MIEKVEFRNFKALRDVSLDLERFTVLVGPNASGKTSVLEGIYYLAQVGRKPDDRVFGSEENLASLMTRGSIPNMSLTCLGNGRRTHIEWERGRSGELGGFQVLGEIPGQKLQQDKEECAERGPTLLTLGAVLLRLQADRLAAPSYRTLPGPQIESDGKGLPTVLDYMARNRMDDYESIQAALHSIVPSVQRIRTPRARIIRTEKEITEVPDEVFTESKEREYSGNAIEFDMEGAPGIPARMASEGTLLVLGMLTVLMGPNRPRLVLLDDLDRALHPKAQEDLVGLLRKLLDQNPDMQIVATSHSPYLLDRLRPEEVRLTTLRRDGSVACGRLDAHPEFEKWKEEMTPGEFWSVVGERWLVEAEAGGERQ